MAQVFVKDGKDDFDIEDMGVETDIKSRKNSNKRSFLNRKKRKIEEESRSRFKMAEELASSINEMLSSAEQANMAASQMLKSGENFSQNAEENSSSAEKSKDIATKLEKLAKRTIEAGEKAVEEVINLNSFLEEYTEKVNIAILGITNSANVNKEVVKSQENLILQGDEIGHIVQSVVGIADQTNLLALNAAIEAARAGEHGRGFAVVADEVRNLAANAETAAREISNVVNLIQEDIKDISSEVESVGQAAEQEADEIKKVAEMGQGVQKSANEIRKTAKEYIGGAHQQLNEVEEYLSNAEQIASAAEQTASSATQLVNSLKEQAEALKEIEGSANLLSSVADFIREGQATEEESNEISSAAEELAATVQETNNSVQQIMMAIQEIKEGSDQSVKAAKQCEDLTISIRESTDIALQKAESVESLVKELLDNFSEGKVYMEGVFNGARTISETNLESAKRLKNLGRKAKQIDKIVNTIVNIAIQTNLLALNGAIEAARAGEYGKGFSVVAADVKNLANESSSSAEKIKDLVRNLQDQISVVGGSVEKAGRQAMAEYERGREIIETMDEMFSVYKKVLLQAESVIEISKEQLNNIGLGVEAAGDVKLQAEKTMENAYNANKAAEEQSQSVEDLAKIVEKIAHFAEEIEVLS